MRRLALFILSFTIWCVLSWQPGKTEIILGLIISAIVAILFREVFSIRSPKFMHPKRLFYFFFIYIPVFVYYCIKANIDVAYRVLHPKLPINPGIVKAKTTLTTEVARAILANTITLTPGTLTVDIIDDNLYIHFINITSTDVTEVTNQTVKHFEGILREVFE